ncbi:unnamed protein product [Sphacelaria rigidula]
MDFSTAFLNGKLEEEVYMRQAPGFEKKNSRGRPFIMKLHKSIYGLRQSPKAWNSTIDGDLRALGFEPTVSDAPNSAIVAKLRKALIDKFSMTDFGDATKILGIDIIQDKQLGTLGISQGPYVMSLLQKCGMSDCNAVHTPGIGNELTAEPEGSVPLDKDDTLDYQSIVGSLIFLCQCTRVDICFAVSQAARFMSKPTLVHMGAVKRILRYLRDTPDIRITYSRNRRFERTGFWDGSYGTGNPEKARSTSGSIYFLAGGAIHFSASVQKTSAQSTTEGELIAMSSCATQGIYLCGILGELGWRTFRSARIFCDNKGALLLAGQGSYSSRS